MNIYVGNISYHMAEENLKEIFEAFGEVSTVKIVTDKFSGRSKGYGFVEMTSDEDAKKAITALNGTEHYQRTLKVSEAKSRENESR